MLPGRSTSFPVPILDGWTNNGPGRATVGTGRDMNRCFLTLFSAYFQSGNYTGTAPLGASEALVLNRTLLQWKAEASTMILLDIHGWLNESMGDSVVAQHYVRKFGFRHTTLGDGVTLFFRH